jgi:hypothetical protein
VKLHRKEEVTSYKYYDNNGKAYYENQAMHYLCRPAELESTSLKDFVECYKIGFVTKKNLRVA